MRPKRIQKPNLVYTPECRILIGEAIKVDDHYALRIKKHGMKDTEVVAVDVLLSLIFQAFDSIE